MKRMLPVLLCALLFSSVATAQEKITSVAMAVANLGNPFFVAQKRALEAAAKEAGITRVVVTSHGYDFNKEIDQLQTFIAGKYDIIIADAAGDVSALKAVIDKAHAAGIVVVMMHATSPDADANVMTNNQQAGERACQYIVDKLQGKGNIVVLNGPPQAAIVERVEGCNRVLATHPEIKVLSKNQDAKASREGGMAVMQGLLVAHNNIDAVFAINDPSALGAELAIKQAKRKGIFITAVDGAPDIVKALKDKSSLVQASAAQDPYKITEEALRLAIAIKQGNKPAQTDVAIPAPLITRDNVGSYQGWDR